LSDTEEVTGASVQEGVGGRRCRGKNDGVDDMVKSLNTSTLDGNNPRRCSSTGLISKEIFIVGRDENTNGKRSKNVEK
jgi:hypothetical protein